MSKHTARRPYAPPDSPEAASSAESQGVRELVARLVSHAQRQREAGRVTRSALARVLMTLTLLGVAASVLTLAYGFYRYPDGPIRPHGAEYVSKTGAPRTREEYQRYLGWSATMWTVLPATFLVGAVFAYAEARDRRRERS